jgi:low affinity Fe/Cu permease
MKTVQHWLREAFARFAGVAAQATGSAGAFTLAAATVVAWAAMGPLFGFSDSWQLVINTSTTIITFLMVFLIQHAQNKDIRAVHLKLNELIAAMRGASNRLIDVEDLSDEELDKLAQRYRHLVKTATRLHEGAACSVEAEGVGDAGPARPDERDGSEAHA